MAYHWIRIFESTEALDDYVTKNTMVPFTIRGEKICVTRTDKGLYAFQEKCPHNGASLLHGFCTKNNEIVCPLHRYSFDLDTGKATSGGAYAIRLYPLETRSDGIYLGIKAKWWEV